MSTNMVPATVYICGMKTNVETVLIQIWLEACINAESSHIQ